MNLESEQIKAGADVALEKSSDDIKKLHHEIDVLLSGKYPAHEQLFSWLRNKYDGIECYADLAIDKGLVEHPAEARVVVARFLSLLESIYVEVQRMGTSEYSESQLIALENSALIMKTVFKLPKN